MTEFMVFLKNYRVYLLVLLGLPALTAGIIWLKRMICQRQKRKEISRAAEDKLRDENLNHVILNGDVGNGQAKEVYKPYDVDYGNAGGDKKNSGRSVRQDDHIMVQLIEKTELSTRKFMMNPVKKIRIGSELQENDIVVLAENISPRQCEIFAVRDKVFIKNLSSESRTILRRKKEQAIVDEKGIRLLSGDTVMLNGVSYDIMIIN